MNQKIQSVSSSRELFKLRRHIGDPRRIRHCDKRILCADGRWHRVSELQRDEREFANTLLVPSVTP